MKPFFAPVCIVIFALPLFAQNTTTISGSSIMDLNGTKLASGQICFLGTDNTDTPISFQQGGGGQVLKRQFCSAVNAGVITSFSVPNPATALPSGIYYRVTVKDTSNGVEVLRYIGVTFSGGTFNFDNYTPALAGASFAPLTGTSVSGNLGVTGNIAATGSVTGSNIPANILQQIFNQGVGLTQRTSFNCLAGIICSDNAGTLKTDVRLGALTTVTFSATPTFDASTASTFKITLTGNVTSSTLSNAAAGQPIALEICQDGVGSHTFVPPANVLGFVTIPSSASACILETFVYDGTNALADSDVASQLKGPEAAAPAGVANFDLLYADSTAHRWKMINNNGTTVQVVASGADINTSDQVTATHLASPLPTAQGGTGQNSTAAFPASGVVVTEAATETLTNKILSGASNTLTLTPNHQIFTTSGTFTMPTGVTAVRVTVVGGGGAGGGSTTTNFGAGGAGGATAIKWLIGLTPGNTLTVTVGTGGTGVSGGNGNAGNASSIASGTQAISTITANGGGGGYESFGIQNPGGSAPSATGGDINLGGGGGNNSTSAWSGNGGNSFLASGGGVSGTAGIAGAPNGPGGGGGGAQGGATGAGANGAAGIVIFEWTN